MKENYEKLLASGMFWEFHPELSGEWEKDREMWEEISAIKNDSLLKIEEFKDQRGNTIKKGEVYFYIDSMYNLHKDTFESEIKGIYQFKSKEFAQDFIIRNIPVMSIQDIVDKHFGRISIVDLERIVKQKLSRKTQTS